MLRWTQPGEDTGSKTGSEFLVMINSKDINSTEYQIIFEAYILVFV